MRFKFRYSILSSCIECLTGNPCQDTQHYKLMEEGHFPCSYYGSTCYTAKNSKPTALGKGVTYWNLQWDISLGWVSYFVPLGERKSLSPHRYPIVLLQARHMEIHYTWNGICTIKRGEKVGGLVCYNPAPVHLLKSNSATFTGQHVWCTQTDLSPKAAHCPLFKARWTHSIFH